MPEPSTRMSEIEAMFAAVDGEWGNDASAEARVEYAALRRALDVARSALLDVKRTRKSDAWGNAVTAATNALVAIEESIGGWAPFEPLDLVRDPAEREAIRRRLEAGESVRVVVKRDDA